MSTSFPGSLIGFYVCIEKILHSGKKIWVLRSWSNGRNNFFFCHRNKIHTFKLMCNAPFIIKTYWWKHFWQIFQRFPKILQNFSKGHTSKDYRRLYFPVKHWCVITDVFFLIIIRAICKADASAVLGFETTLFPVIQEILTNDVTGRQSVTSKVSCSVWLECYFSFT